MRIKISNINIRQSWLLSLHTDTSDETAMLTTRCKKLFEDRVVLSIFKALDCLIPYSNGYKFHSNYPNIIALRINDVIDYVYDTQINQKIFASTN